MRASEDMASAIARVPGCQRPVWDGPYRMRCAMGRGRCGKHGTYEVRYVDETCSLNASDGFCHTHAIYCQPATLPTPARPAEPRDTESLED